MNGDVHGHPDRQAPPERSRAGPRVPAPQWMVFDRGLYACRPWPSTWLAPEVLFETAWKGGTVYAWPLRLVQEHWVDPNDLMAAFKGAWSLGPQARCGKAAGILARTARMCRDLQGQGA